MNRRNFLSGVLAAAAMPQRAGAQRPTGDVAGRVALVANEIARRHAAKSAISTEWVASALEEGLSPRDRRIAAFRLIQDIPYKLTAWKGDPDSLFKLERGDYRHKSAALRRIFRIWKLEARAIQVRFDWADLPIPADVLKPLLETRGIHDSVEVTIDGRFVLADATWDPALASAGFPVLTDWDGNSPTLPDTSNANIVARPGDLKPGANIFNHFGIKWPQRDRTLVFNRTFNTWTDKVRARVSSTR